TPPRSPSWRRTWSACGSPSGNCKRFRPARCEKTRKKGNCEVVSMKSVDRLLNELRGLGVKVWVEADRLRYRSSTGTMTETLAYELRRHKAEIMARLEQTSGSGIHRIEDQDDYELSHAQRRLWVLSQLGDASVAYNVGLRLLLQGRLDERACETALRALI